MVVHLKPETESRLQELAATTGRAPDELVEDAMAGYLAELARVRKTLDERYDDIRSDRSNLSMAKRLSSGYAAKAKTAAANERIRAPPICNI
jgi:hypothetical protein